MENLRRNAHRVVSRKPVSYTHLDVYKRQEDWRALCDVGADNRRNLCASGCDENGDVDRVMDACDEVFEATYHIKAVQQTMMETFRAYTELDAYGRLVLVSSTQIPFHPVSYTHLDVYKRQALGTRKDGLVRLSFSALNTMEDVRAAAAAIRTLAEE